LLLFSIVRRASLIFCNRLWRGGRLDAEVLDRLRSKGERHLTRINDILTNLMEAERRAGARR
jgi:hypothetical protein